MSEAHAFSAASECVGERCLRQLTCPFRSKPRSGNVAGGSVSPCTSSKASSQRQEPLLGAQPGQALSLVGMNALQLPPIRRSRADFPDTSSSSSAGSSVTRSRTPA